MNGTKVHISPMYFWFCPRLLLLLESLPQSPAPLVRPFLVTIKLPWVSGLKYPNLHHSRSVADPSQLLQYCRLKCCVRKLLLLQDGKILARYEQGKQKIEPLEEPGEGRAL